METVEGARCNSWCDRGRARLRRRADERNGSHSVRQPKFETGEGSKPRGGRSGVVGRHIWSRSAPNSRVGTFSRAVPISSRLSPATPSAASCSTAMSMSCRSAIARNGQSTRSAARSPKGRIWGRGSIDMKSGVAFVARRSARHPQGRLPPRGANRLPLRRRRRGGRLRLDRRGQALRPRQGRHHHRTDLGQSPRRRRGPRVAARDHSGQERAFGMAVQRHLSSEGRTRPSRARRECGRLYRALLEQLRELERDWATTKGHPLVPPGVNSLHVGAVVIGSSPGPDGRPTILSNLAITPDCAAIDIDLKFLPQETKEQVRADFEAFVHHWAQQYSWLRDHPPKVQLGPLRSPLPSAEHAAHHPLGRRTFRGRAQAPGQGDRNHRLHCGLRRCALRWRRHAVRHLRLFWRRLPRQGRIRRCREPHRDDQADRRFHRRLVRRNREIAVPEPGARARLRSITDAIGPLSARSRRLRSSPPACGLAGRRACRRQLCPQLRGRRRAQCA